MTKQPNKQTNKQLKLVPSQPPAGTELGLGWDWGRVEQLSRLGNECG